VNSLQRRILGITSIGGGALGITVVVSNLNQDSGILYWIFCLSFIALYIWGCWCGILLIENSPTSLQLNRRFWFIQIPVFMSPILGYSFSSGAYFNVWTSLTHFRLGADWYLGSHFNYSLLQSDKPFLLGVNLLALGVFIYLSKKIRELQSSNKTL
jgi:hypothetical protein